MTKLPYSIVLFLDHVDQALRDQLAWHAAVIRPRAKDGVDITQELEKAYAAGFQQGAQIGRGLISLHGKVRLAD